MELFNPQENNSSEKTAVTTLLQTQYTAECTHSPETNTYTLTLQGTPGCLPDFYTVVTTMPAAFIEGGKVKIGEVLFAMKHAAFKAGEVVAIRVSVPEKVTYFGSGKECCEGVASGAGAHNAVYRGKWLGTSVTPEQYDAISSGTFEDLYIGDYWTIGDVNYRIAAFDYYLRSGDDGDLQIHHAVIVPDTALYSATMNATDTTKGGYVGSLMYTTNLAAAKTTINTAFAGHVMKHRQFLTTAVTSGRASAGAWLDSTVELMNEQMVYGNSVFSPVSDGTSAPAIHTICRSQLPLFAMRPDLISNRVVYWLRDVIHNTHFTDVSIHGLASCYRASSSLGVRPAFSIC